MDNSTFRSGRPQLPAPYSPDAPAAVVARWYSYEMDWIALPARRKKPVGKWNDDVLSALDLDNLAARWRLAQQAYRRNGGITNIALLLGKRSGLAIGDVDPRHGGTLSTLWKMGWPKRTVIARSGGGGHHVYCACPAGGLPSISGYAQGIEFKADGAIIIAPPSIHPDTGNRYQWLRGHEPWTVPLAPVPDTVVADVRAQRPNPHPRTATLITDDDNNPPQLAYSPEETVRLVANLLNWAIDQTRADRADREHRNNMAFRLGLQLGSLGLTRREIAAVAALYERMVRDV